MTKAAAPKDQSETKPVAEKTPAGTLAAYVSEIKKGDDFAKERQFLNAIEAFKDATAVRPEMYEAYFKLGNAYLALGDMLSAIKAYTLAYERQPKELDLLLRISEICYKMNDYVKAAQMLSEVLIINDRYVPALLVLPELLIKIGRIDDAVDLLKAAIPEQPHLPELWVAAGIAMQVKGDVERARIFYNEALNLDPKAAVARHNLDILEENAA